MKVLLDSNVLLDFILKRKSFYKDANIINGLVEECHIEGFISSSQMTDIFYIAHRDIKDVSKLYNIMDRLARDYTIVPVHEETIKSALALRWEDFEDTVQYTAAVEAGVECVITRDCTFEAAAIPCITPEYFLARLAAERAAKH